jgi:hypothetical protein
MNDEVERRMYMAKRKHFQLLFGFPNQRAISTLLAFLLKEGEGDLLLTNVASDTPPSLSC